MRKLMQDTQVENCVFESAPRANSDSRRQQEQAKHKHPLEAMKWGGNKSSIYHGATACGLKPALFYNRPDPKPECKHDED